MNRNYRNCHITDIEWTTRVWNCIIDMRVETLGELDDMRDLDLLRQPGLGLKSLLEIRDKIANFEKKPHSTPNTHTINVSVRVR